MAIEEVVRRYNQLAPGGMAGRIGWDIHGVDGVLLLLRTCHLGSETTIVGPIRKPRKQYSTKVQDEPDTILYLNVERIVISTWYGIILGLSQNRVIHPPPHPTHPTH